MSLVSLVKPGQMKEPVPLFDDTVIPLIPCCVAELLVDGPGEGCPRDADGCARAGTASCGFRGPKLITYPLTAPPSAGQGEGQVSPLADSAAVHGQPPPQTPF